MLYIVATPIGNILDCSYRAIEVLRQVDLIVAEDLRRSQILLNHYSISTKMINLHEHNEAIIVDQLLQLLMDGKNLALISDAGTPLISDPGYLLVNQAHRAKIPISPVPGACSIIAALSVSGLATDQFKFLGFLPKKPTIKQKLFQELLFETSTMICLEAPHRLLDTLSHLHKIFEKEREITFCREMTKKFETIIKTTIGDLYELVQAQALIQTKGEIVLVIAGSRSTIPGIDLKVHKMLAALVAELPILKASKVLSKITGIPKHNLYQYWIEHQRADLIQNGSKQHPDELLT